MFGNWLSDENIDIAPGQWYTVISVFDCSRLNKGNLERMFGNSLFIFFFNFHYNLPIKVEE